MTPQQTETDSLPLVSVVIEGFNESQEKGLADNTMAALSAQKYPLDHVEIILVGSEAQAAEWTESYCVESSPFRSVKTVGAEGEIYYRLKNMGAKEATGDIIVFTDSDVCPKPTWIPSFVEGIQQGADVSIGISLFKDLNGWTSRNIFHKIAVCITFAYILGKIEEHKPSQIPKMEIRGFVGHNVAMRTEVFRKSQYRTEFGRLIASPLLFLKLVKEGHKVILHPKQQVVHFFEWVYWVQLHHRFGYEVYQLRRLDETYPNQWITRLGLLEPVATMFWHMLLDMPRWFRFSRLLEMNWLVRIGLFPVVILLSAIARGSEMLGMFSTMLSPAAMREWAENGPA